MNRPAQSSLAEVGLTEPNSLWENWPYQKLEVAKVPHQMSSKDPRELEGAHWSRPITRRQQLGIMFMLFSCLG